MKFLVIEGWWITRQTLFADRGHVARRVFSTRRGYLPPGGDLLLVAKTGPPSCCGLAAAREWTMEKDRFLAFTDGVIAIIITIMVLELKVPHDASLRELAALTPTFLSRVLSFVYVAIYWSSHHHFFHLVRHSIVRLPRGQAQAIAGSDHVKTDRKSL